ncbi:hypothetical protein ACFVWT_07770 [Arthrobacter sp. NPDC058288]|uniref:hypothetical protein n=1 Tax=Arthrobacter sp. NPDC058288 TaxID=3346424 RepID=UPI0036EFC65E
MSAILPLAGCVDGLRLGLRNVRFQLLDAAVLDGAEGFDLITVFDAIHDQAQRASAALR